MKPFKVGDRVRRIKPSGDPSMNEGGVYTICNVSKSTGLMLEGLVSFWHPSGFELVTEDVYKIGTFDMEPRTPEPTEKTRTFVGTFQVLNPDNIDRKIDVIKTLRAFDPGCSLMHGKNFVEGKKIKARFLSLQDVFVRRSELQNILPWSTFVAVIDIEEEEVLVQ